jgi:hypothetical protein
VRYRDEPLCRCLLYPVFLLLGILASWRALGRHVAGRNSWAKIERSADPVARG